MKFLNSKICNLYNLTSKYWKIIIIPGLVVVILPFKISASKWKEKELCKSSQKDKNCLRMQCNAIYKNAAG
jgi:hypothetical protein